jgi:Putative rhamnosyl transferase
MRIQALGLCRFSYLGEGGFQVEHDSLADRRVLLYDPVRMNLRFLWFENICLPGWANQTDHDFKLIVMTGTDFPAVWLDRLCAATAGIPQIVIEQVDPGPHRDMCRSLMTKHRDPSADVIAEFRHDDDDAIAVDYVARLRSDFLSKLRPLYQSQPLLSVDYSRGFTLAAAEGSVALLPQMSHNLGVALTIYMPPDHPKSVMDYGHHRLANFMPGVYFQDTAMFIRGKHGSNDSGTGLKVGYPWHMNEVHRGRILRRRFAVDLRKFERLIIEHHKSLD